MPSISNEVLAERIDNHLKADEHAQGRLLGEVGELSTRVDKLSTRFEVLNATLEPLIEHYMAEHPSKVQYVRDIQNSSAPTSKPKRRSISQETKLLGALVMFLTLATQALQIWVNHGTH